MREIETLQCYICYEEGSDTKPLAIDPPPCDCKGSIAIHKACLQEILGEKLITTCSVCGKKYNPIYIPEFETGVIREVTTEGHKLKYHLNERFEKHGLYQEWYSSGQLYLQINYKNGKIHGLYEAWHPGGQLYQKMNYENGKLHGPYEEWHRNGELHICHEYVHGKIHTPLKYYRYGKIYMVGRYICDGTIDKGVYMEKYNENNGTLVYCTEYYNGQKNGIYEAWDKHGNLESYSGYYQNDYKVKDLEGNGKEKGMEKGKGMGCTIT